MFSFLETTTTPKPKHNRFDFISRRPPFLRRTFRPKVNVPVTNDLAEKNENSIDNAENDSIGKPLEIRDVVVALKDIQNAPLPTKISLIQEKITERRVPVKMRLTTEKTVSEQTTMEKRVPEIKLTERRPTRIAVTEKEPLFDNLVNFNVTDITFTTSEPRNVTEKEPLFNNLLNFNITDTIFTTSKPRNRFRFAESTPKIKFNKIATTTPYSTKNGK